LFEKCGLGVAGSITADGHGNITGGSLDVNDNQVISSSSALAGTYTLDSNSRGIITLTNMVGSVTHPLAFAFTLKADGTAGNMIGVDANNFVISGTIQKQDAAGFSLAQLAGDYAFELSSRALSQSTLLGRFTLGQSGASTNVVFDLSVSGFGATGPIMGGPVTATFAAAGPNGSGRGTLTLTDNSSVTENFVYYVVAAGTFIAIEIDPPGAVQTVFAGVANKQNFPFSPSTVNTAASVFALTGVDAAVADDISTIGLLTVTGSSTASLLWDTDDAGLISSQITSAGQTVMFDQSTGRGTITVASGYTNGLFDAAVFYLTSSGKGFLLDATAGSNNRALVGRLLPQTGSGSLGPASFSGNMITHATGFSFSDYGVLDGFLSHSVNNNVLTGSAVADVRSLAGGSHLDQIGSIPGQAVAIDANTGRGTLTFNASTFTNTNVFYIIGPRQFVLIDETPPPHNFIPLEFADPQ